MHSIITSGARIRNAPLEDGERGRDRRVPADTGSRMPGMEGTGATTLEQARRVSSPPRKRRWIPVSALEFVGCESCRMTMAEFKARRDERVEFFDSEAALAWMVRDGPYREHEEPRFRLAALVHEISQTRGSRIRCLGETELRLLDTESRQVRSINPDQMVFLHPEQVDRMSAGYLRVGEDAYPEVVLEVDNTTDVRRNRLKLYEEWGFPEVWVEVPNTISPSRPRGLKTGLRIYLLEGERYALSTESRAFPGWRAAEIHRALNEIVVSAETSAVLARVGRTLGEREGTGPDDDPLLGPTRRQKLAQGRAEGIAQGRAQARAGLVRGMLESRDIAVSADFTGPRDRAVIAAASDEAVLSAASSAESESDFVARLTPPEP